MRAAIVALVRCSRWARWRCSVGLPPVRPLMLSLLYAALLLAGVRLYLAGLAYSADGSGFGQQLLSIVASAACLLAAALSASQRRTSSSALLSRPSAVASSARSEDDSLLPLIARQSSDSDGRSHRSRVAAEDAGSSSSSASWRLLAVWWVLLPLVTPLLLSAYVLLRAEADAGTALSAEVSALLFSSVGLAMMLAALLVYLSCARRQGRAVGWSLLLAMAAMAAYFVSPLKALLACSRADRCACLLAHRRCCYCCPCQGFYYVHAQTWSLRGLLVPAYLHAASVHVELAMGRRDAALFAADPQLLAVHREMWQLPGNEAVAAPSVSFFDTAAQARRRAAELHCRVEPFFHLLDVLPRRSTNFFTGSDSCPSTASFARLDGATRELHLRCPAHRPLSYTLSPDYIADRSLNAKSNVQRHHRDVLLAEAALRTQAGEEASPSRHVSKEARDGQAEVRVPTGPHGYGSATCGTERNIFVAHVEKPEVTARAQTITDELFPPSSDSGSSSEAAADAPRLLQNPPVLVLFVDCVSRLHLLRSLPLTTAAMQRAHVAATEERTVRESLFPSQARLFRAQQQRHGTNLSSDSESQLQAELRDQLLSVDARLRHLRVNDSSSSPRYSVSEHFAYHVVGHHTRENMQAMLCAAGPSGWGGSPTVSRQTQQQQQPPTASSHSLSPDSSTVQFSGYGLPRAAAATADLSCPAADVIWNRYKRAGYVTAAVLNDCTDLTYDVLRADAALHSADYEFMAPFCDAEYDARGQWTNMVGPYSMRRRCIAGRHVHDHAIDYARSFIQQRDGTADKPAAVPWFLYLSFMEAHEGSLAVLAQLDASLAALLEWCLTSLHNAPLIVLTSDHGSHMGPMQATRGGRIEHKLPALFTLLPEAWLAWRDVHRRAQPIRRDDEAERRPRSTTTHRSLQLPEASIGMALASNSWALLTAREVYWTLRAIPSRAVVDELEQRERALLTEWQERHASTPSLIPPPPQPLSLFTPIDLARRCDQAGIDPNLCVCNRAEHTLS